MSTNTKHTIAQIKQFPVGTVVPSTEGLVKVVFQRRTGEGQYGPWTMQSLVIADGPEELHVTAFGFDDLSHLKGQQVSIAATGKNGKTGRAQGAETSQGKDKEGTPRMELKVDAKKGGFIGGDKPNPAYMAQPAAAPQAHSAVAVPASASNKTEGVVAGMAINCAVRLAIGYQIPAENLDEYLHEKASALIKLSQKLQNGELV